MNYKRQSMLGIALLLATGLHPYSQAVIVPREGDGNDVPPETSEQPTSEPTLDSSN